MGAVSTIATDAKDFITTLSLDVLTIAALVALLLVLGFRLGKGWLIGMTLSSYITALVLSYFPYRETTNVDLGLLFGKYDIVELVLLCIGIWLVQIVIDYITEFEFSGKKFKNLANIIILSASGAVAFLNAVYIANVAKVTDANTSFLDAFFTGEQTLFFLLIAPLIGVFLVVR